MAGVAVAPRRNSSKVVYGVSCNKEGVSPKVVKSVLGNKSLGVVAVAIVARPVVGSKTMESLSFGGGLSVSWLVGLSSLLRGGRRRPGRLCRLVAKDRCCCCVVLKGDASSLGKRQVDNAGNVVPLFRSQEEEAACRDTTAAVGRCRRRAVENDVLVAASERRIKEEDANLGMLIEREELYSYAQ